MPASAASTDSSGCPRHPRRVFLLVFSLLLLSSIPAMARDLVLGFVPDQCQLLSDVRQAEQFADYLTEGLGQKVRVRVFTDERNLQHWMNRFREIDLAVFSRTYLEQNGKGRLLPLAEYIDAGSRTHGGGLVVARTGLPGNVFLGAKQRLLDAVRDPRAGRLLADLKVAGFVLPRQSLREEHRPGRGHGVKAVPPPAAPLPTVASQPARLLGQRGERADSGEVRVLSPPPGGRTGPQPLLLLETGINDLLVQLDGRTVKVRSGERLGPLTDGAHELQLISPQLKRPGRYMFLVDASPPDVAADLPEHPISEDAVSIVGTREADARLRLLDMQGREISEIQFPDRTHWQVELHDLAEGENRFQLEARDAYGNLQRLPLVVMRDTRPPMLTILSPEAGRVYAAPPNFDVRTDGKISAVELDGQEVNDPEQAILVLADGPHQLKLVATDPAGNLASAIVRFGLDREQPVLSVDPFDELLARRSLLLQGDVEPEGRLALSLYPETLLAKLTYPRPGRWQLQLDNLAEGDNRLILRASDEAGNLAELRLALKVDLTPPQVEILSPAAGVVFRQTPDLEISSDASEIRVQLDGTTLSPGPGGKLPELPPLSEGEHFLKVSAVDDAGNLVETSRRIQVDTRAPDLQLLSPAPGVLNDSSPLFSFSGDARDIRLLLDKEPLTVANGDRIGPLADGEHHLLFSAMDAAGKRREWAVDFVIDTRPPTWELREGMGAGMGARRSLKGTVEPGAQISFASPTLQFSDIRYLPTGGWEVEVDGLQPGDNQVEINVTDLAGNSGTGSVNLTRDDEPPVLELVSPAPDGLYREMPTLDFSVNEGTASFMLDARPLELVQGEPLPPMEDGDHVLLVRIVDQAGNESVQARRFRIDRQSPRLTVDPLPEAVNSESLRISGLREAGSRVRVVTPENEDLCPALGSEGNQWSCTITNLAEGPLRLVVISTDIAGNESRKELELLIDRTPPLLQWKYPLPGTYARIERFDYLLDDGRLEISIDGHPLEAGVPPAGLDLSAGPHRIEVSAHDAAGNVSRQLISLTIDRQAPQVEIHSPAETSNIPSPRLDFAFSDGTATVLVDGVVVSVPSGGTLPPLADGEHLLRVEARDLAGNLGFAEKRFLVDTSRPRLELDTPPGPVAGEEAVLEGYVAADAALKAFWEGHSLPVERHAEGRFRVVARGLKEGVNPLRLVAVGGNGLATELPLQIVRDSRPPVLGLVSPVQGIYADARPKLDYTLDSPVARIEVFVDGRPVTPGEDGTLGPLPDGPHRVEVHAWDVAGNQASASSAFSIDTTPPDFALQFDPRPQAVEDLTLRGTRESGVRVTMVVPEGVKASLVRYPSENSWEVDLEHLPEGEIPLHLTASDPHGNTSTQDVVLQVDRTPPSLSVSSPVPGITNNPSPELLVSGEGGAIAVLLNGQPILAEAGQLGPLADGSYILLVREQDLAGNQNQQRIAFQVDTHAPVVAISSPAPGSRTSAFPIVDYQVSDGGVKVLLDGKLVEVSRGTSLPRLDDGLHRLKVVATDSAGNDGFAEVEFMVDSTAPEVVLLSPASGLTADNTPTLEYEVDRGEVRVLVDDVVVDKRSGMSLDPLGEGEHLVRVEAWDDTGNVGFAERRLVVSSARPTPSAEYEIVDGLKEFGLSLTPSVVTHRHKGLLTLTVGPLRRAGGTLYLEQWIDANGNGVADSGEQIVRVVKLVDGLVSPSPRVPGDSDGRADRMITTRLSLDQLHDGSSGPVQYVMLAMGDSNVGESVFRVIPEP